MNQNYKPVPTQPTQLGSNEKGARNILNDFDDHISYMGDRRDNQSRMSMSGISQHSRFNMQGNKARIGMNQRNNMYDIRADDLQQEKAFAD